MSMQEAGGGDQGSGVGKGQKWSTVELHCQPATGSSIIMVIFRWPSASRRQLESGERKRAERASRQDRGVGGSRENRDATLKVLSYQRGRGSQQSKEISSCFQKHTGPDCLCAHLLLLLRHENTVHGGKNYQFIAGKLTIEKFAKNYASRRSNYWLC